MALEHVLVVGAGQMGGGIAQVVAASGRRVSLHDAALGAVERRVQGVVGAMERATEGERMMGPGGKVMHAELKIGDSVIFLNDTMNETGPAQPAPGTSNLAYLHLYVEDVDEVFGRALKAGARTEMPVQDMFWGDRYGKLTDPFGQQWGIATHKEDLSTEEVVRRQEAFFAKAAGR